jgi:hypothetical protein
MIHARAGSIRLATGNSFVDGFDAHDFSKSACAALRSSTESRRAPPNRGCGAVDPGIGERWSFFGRAGKDCFERLESSICRLRL